MPEIIELQSGDRPGEKPHLLVDCVAGTRDNRQSIHHANGITETIDPDDLEHLLPVFVSNAGHQGFDVVYVRGISAKQQA
jgi:hypothetical protein